MRVVTVKAEKPTRTAQRASIFQASHERMEEVAAGLGIVRLVHVVVLLGVLLEEVVLLGLGELLALGVGGLYLSCRGGEGGGYEEEEERPKRDPWTCGPRHLIESGCVMGDDPANKT